MELFDAIIEDRELFSVFCGDCRENNISVGFFDSLLKNGEIDDNRVLILKPDNYYATHNKTLYDHTEPPSAIDCLIIVKCTEHNYYDLYLVELRDVSTGTKDLKYPIISKKFNTVLNRFFMEFDNVFGGVQFRKVNLLLVTDPYRSKSEDDFKRRILGTALDAYASQTLIFQNKKYLIQPVYPHKTHIHPC